MAVSDLDDFLWELDNHPDEVIVLKFLHNRTHKMVKNRERRDALNTSLIRLKRILKLDPSCTQEATLEATLNAILKIKFRNEKWTAQYILTPERKKQKKRKRTSVKSAHVERQQRYRLQTNMLYHQLQQILRTKTKLQTLNESGNFIQECRMKASVHMYSTEDPGCCENSSYTNIM